MYKKLSNIKQIVILIIIFMLNLSIIKAEDTTNIQKDLSILNLAKRDAFELHFNGNFKEAVSKYEDTVLKLQNFEKKYAKSIKDNEKIQSDIFKIQQDIYNYLKNDGFYIDEKTSKDQEISYPDKIDGIIALAWLSQNSVKVALTTSLSEPVKIEVVLGYGWLDNEGEIGVDTIVSQELSIRYNEITEVTFNGIPYAVDSSDFRKTYTQPGIFLFFSEIKKDIKKIQKIDIQGIKDNYIYISNYNQYCNALSRINFIINLGKVSKQSMIEKRLYVEKTAYIISKNENIKTSLSFIGKPQNVELLNGWVALDFPLEIIVNIPDINGINILHFDTMIFEEKNIENDYIKSQGIPGPVMIIIDKKISIKNIEVTIPEQKRIILSLENTKEDRIKNLIEKLKINFWNVSLNAQTDLINMGIEAVPFLIKEIESNVKMRKQILLIIGKIGQPAIPALKEYTKKMTDEVDLILYEDLVMCYALIGPSSIDSLMELTKEKKISKTIFLCMVMEEINDKIIIPYLMKILKDVNDGVYFISSSDINYNSAQGQENYLKKVLIHTLGVLKEKEAVPIIISLIDKESGDQILQEIAFALGNINDPSTVDYLILLAKKGYIDAVRALGRMKVKEALPILFTDFQKLPNDCQIEVAKMSKECGDITLLDKLLKLSEDDKIDIKVKNNLNLAIESIVSEAK
ncbi:MAG: HEAT repeat domain-containing protein [Candidatus Firestonebacteria bacterium]|nr:HEAT repeat domain-containing protein [Candidatus Firestonebacteria bacterium]